MNHLNHRIPTRRKSARAARIAGQLLLLVVFIAPLATPAAQRKAQSSRQAITYVCPMDPDVKSTRPGKCPKCGMFLRPASQKASADAAASMDSMNSAASHDGDVTEPMRIPDTRVVDQNGKTYRFYSDLVKGKTVAINFIFTTCTTICPPLTATFRKVQQELGERVGRDVQMISISVDPTIDVPDRLKAFAAKFDAGPGWTFLTGDKQEIDLLLKALGAKVDNKTDHSPTVLVGNDSAGYWTRTYGLAPVATLVKVITDATARTASDTAAQVPLPGATGSADERQVQKHVAAEPATASGPKLEAKQVKSPGATAASYFPNTVLLTQDNKPVHFFDDLLKGKTVVINFMFTTCTGVCPPMTANLAKVQEYLGERVGKSVNMISISVDPTTDTPATLKKFASTYKVKPGWTFLTGKPEEVETVLRKIGGFVKDKNDHTSLVIIGNVETGEWMKVFAMTAPSEMADIVIKLSDAKP